MPYSDNGTLTTDKRTVNEETSWSSQSDWAAYQSAEDVEIVDGAIQLAEGPAIPDSELSDYWPTDEGSGTTLTNANSDRDMTVNGATWSDTAGIGGWHLDSDGTDDTATVSDSAFGTATLTMMVWIRPDTTTEQQIFYTNHDGTTSGVNLTIDNDGTVYAFLNNANSGNNIRLDSSTAPADEWSFHAVTCDLEASTATMYYAVASDSGVTQLDQSTSYNDGGGDIAAAQDVSLSEIVEYDGGVDAPQFGIDQVLSESEVDQFFQDSKEFYQ